MATKTNKKPKYKDPEIEAARYDIAIAEFMGHTVYDGLSDDKTKKWKGEWRQYSHFQLAYKTSWAWLMPVVEKIESMGHWSVIKNGDPDYTQHICYFSDANEETVAMSDWKESKLLAVYEAVVHFIEKKHIPFE